ncbi:helix-turn-helix domain-containing protein [Eubacteriales bacterium OttesenSCG-928-K08]|nr:helix-turn-helix domain-containing protein [Eubacteriales bacterium OttesenSCG-928-K08]
MSGLGNKEIFSRNLKYYMALNHKERSEVCDILGVAYTTFSDWENGKTYPRIDKIEMLANYFGIMKSDLIEDKTDLRDILTLKNVEPLPKTKKVPLLGDIACGEPILAAENYDEYINVDEDINCDFAVRCKGDSMIGARILDGDIVYIRQQPTVDNGEIAAVLIDDEVTLKRVYRQPGRVTLVAENPMVKDFVYIGDQAENMRILGKAVIFKSRIR